MPCTLVKVGDGAAFFCSPRVTKKARRVFPCRSRRAKCPTVRRRLHDARFYDWYGWTLTCRTCGFDNVLDDERTR